MEMNCMGKLKETEREKAKRVFKYYKSTDGEFPKDVSKLQCYNLLSKYNYFIAKQINKKFLNKITELMNIIDREKVVICHGDFDLKPLLFSIENFKFEDSNQLQIIYVDAVEKNPSSVIAGSITVKPMFKKYVFYIVDNIDSLNAKESKLILEYKKRLMEYDKYMVCCALDISKVNRELYKGLKKIKLGPYKEEKNILQKCVLRLFCDKNRERVFQYIINNKIPLNYLFSMLSFNLPLFFKDDTILLKNQKVIEVTAAKLYKTTSELVLSYLAYSLTPTNRKRKVQYIPKIEAQQPSVATNINLVVNTETERTKKQLARSIKTLSEISKIDVKQIISMFKNEKRLPTNRGKGDLEIIEIVGARLGFEQQPKQEKKVRGILNV